MATDPKPARRATKKQRRRPREELVHYIVEIDDWDWGYSFSLNTERKPIDPYHEFRHLQVRGRLLRPAGLKTDRVEVSLLPTLDLEEGARKNLEPIALGALNSKAEGLYGNIGIPKDALTPILQMLIGGRLKFIVMGGGPFRHRNARLHSLRLEPKLNEDDWPD
jgi:hypothetical protein